MIIEPSFIKFGFLTMGNYRFMPEEQKKLVIAMPVLDRGQVPADIEGSVTW
jgi:hypothetical protein